MRRVAAIDDLAQDAGRERPLAVIGEDDDVGAVRRLDRGFEQPVLDEAVERRCVFVVDADDLLARAEHAEFARRRTPRDRDHAGSVDRAMRLKALDQIVPGAIKARRANDIDDAAQRRDIRRDIGRAAGHDFL